MQMNTRQMEVYQRMPQIGVAQQLLNRVKVRSCLKQVRRMAVPPMLHEA